MPKANAQSSGTPATRGRRTPATRGRRDERGLATRHRIVEATIDLLTEGGWEAVTTRAVAARANVNVALIHYHFGSISALVEAAVAAGTETAVAEPLASLLGAPTLRLGVRGSLEAMTRIDDRTLRVMIEMLVRAGRDPAMESSFAGALRSYRAAIAERVAAAIAAGELPPDLDPDGTAVVLAAIGDGLALHMLVDRELRHGPAIQALDRMLQPPATGTHPGRNRP